VSFRRKRIKGSERGSRRRRFRVSESIFAVPESIFAISKWIFAVSEWIFAVSEPISKNQNPYQPHRRTRVRVLKIGTKGETGGWSDPASIMVT
jgi:hypothetical protein